MSKPKNLNKITVRNGSKDDGKLCFFKPLLEAKKWNQEVQAAFVVNQFTEGFLEELIEKSEIAKFPEFWETINSTQYFSLQFVEKYFRVFRDPKSVGFVKELEKMPNYNRDDLKNMYGIDAVEEFEKLHEEMKMEKSKVYNSIIEEEDAQGFKALDNAVKTIRNEQFDKEINPNHQAITEVKEALFSVTDNVQKRSEKEALAKLRRIISSSGVKATDMLTAEMVDYVATKNGWTPEEIDPQLDRYQDIFWVTASKFINLPEDFIIENFDKFDKNMLLQNKHVSHVIKYNYCNKKAQDIFVINEEFREFTDNYCVSNSKTKEFDDCIFHYYDRIEGEAIDEEMYDHVNSKVSREQSKNIHFKFMLVSFVCRYGNLTEEFVQKYIKDLDVEMLLKNPHISKELKDKYCKKHIDQDVLLLSTANELNDNIVEILKTRKFDVSTLQFLAQSTIAKFEYFWDIISTAQELPEHFIEKFRYRVNWHNIFINQKLSEEYIEANKHRKELSGILANNKISDKTVEKYFPMLKTQSAGYDPAPIMKDENSVAKTFDDFRSYVYSYIASNDFDVHLINYAKIAIKDGLLAGKNYLNENDHISLINFVSLYGDLDLVWVKDNWMRLNVDLLCNNNSCRKEVKDFVMSMGKEIKELKQNMGIDGDMEAPSAEKWKKETLSADKPLTKDAKKVLDDMCATTKEWEMYMDNNVVPRYNSVALTDEQNKHLATFTTNSIDLPTDSLGEIKQRIDSNYNMKEKLMVEPVGYGTPIGTINYGTTQNKAQEPLDDEIRINDNGVEVVWKKNKNGYSVSEGAFVPPPHTSKAHLLLGSAKEWTTEIAELFQTTLFLENELKYFINNYPVCQTKEFWGAISWSQRLSEHFIAKFADKLNWDVMSAEQNLTISLFTLFGNKISERNLKHNKHVSQELKDNFYVANKIRNETVDIPRVSPEEANEIIKQFTDKDFLIIGEGIKLNLTKNTIKPTFVEMTKSDATKAGYRIASTQITKGMKKAIITILNKQGYSDSMATEFFSSELGSALLSAIIGFSLTYIPNVKDNKHVKVLAEEFRVDAMATVGNEAVDALVGAITPVIIEALSTLPKEELKVRVENAEEDVVELEDYVGNGECYGSITV